MSCSPFDLKDYFFQELADPQQRQVEAHVNACPACRQELERLRLTGAALFALRDEEIPQRIAFVSDPVFEPSPWRRALAGFWNSGARLGFASAAMLSAALIVFAVTRPAPAPVLRVATALPAPAPAAAAMSDREMQARIDAAVARAVAQVETRQQQQTRQLVADVDEARRRLLVASQEFDYNRRRENAGLITAGLMGPPPERGQGEPK